MQSNPTDPQQPAGTGDPNPAANPPAPQGDPAPAGTQDPAAPTGIQDPEGQTRALAAARRDADERAKELRASKKALDEAQAKLKEHEDAQKSEIDKANERAQAAEERFQAAERRGRETALRFEVSRVAVAQNFADPEDAYRMIDWGKVEFDDAGEPQGVAPLVEQLAKDKPYLLKAAQQAGPRAPSPTPSANGDGKTLTGDEANRQRALLNSQVRQTF